MLWRIEIHNIPEILDHTTTNSLNQLRQIGLDVQFLEVIPIYLLDGSIDETKVIDIADKLLTDKVTQQFKVYKASETSNTNSTNYKIVLIFKKSGVTDPVEASTKKAIKDIGLEVKNVRSGTKYVLKCSATDSDIRSAFSRTLANDVIDEIYIGDKSFTEVSLGNKYEFNLTEIPFLSATESELININNERCLSLTVEELNAIKKYFSSIRRNPADVELETIAQTWSEHCKHKTFNSEIVYRKETIPNLLKDTIMKATNVINKPWCVSVFKDNAGIIEFDENYNICFKVETHNHPSAIEPYGGASTGLGGVIRDCLGSGLGAKPILNTDVFCVGLPNTPSQAIPPGTIHPQRLLRNIVSGVRDYGNRMGIPTVNGAVFFDERYIGNPLVYCGTVGILPRNKTEKYTKSGDLIVLVGGRTGRDGIHGATFSSTKLTEKSEDVSSSAVQIGNAITEKRMLDTILQARDKDLYDCITDCGAGGLSSAVGEMGKDLGAIVDLEKVPLKYEGLSYCEVWISEAQERMVLSVPERNINELLAIFSAEDVEATVIGRFTDDKKLTLIYKGNTVGNLDMDFLHDGLPKSTKSATYTKVDTSNITKITAQSNYGTVINDILSSYNICSKEWVIRQYDHEVQGSSVIKPLTGIKNDGPSDAAVIRPLLNSYKGIVVANGMNPIYGDLDTYSMAASAIDEAIRNVVAVGGNPERIAILDNFSWGNPDNPEILGALVEAAKACYGVAVSYQTPFISGKDSLHNEFISAGRKISIPHSLLISAISVIDDVRKCVTMDIKNINSIIYILGLTKSELGGSHFCLVTNNEANSVPRVDTTLGKKIFNALYRAIYDGLVSACHDCSEGGLAVTLSEMAFAGEIGMLIDLSKVPISDEVKEDYEVLFSESNSRFVVEVKEDNRIAFEKIMRDIPYATIGKTVVEPYLSVKGLSGKILLEEKLSDLKESWQKPLRW
ncbi:MAG: phosphoribosylformylglycinamidine synthase II [Candidatus Schekmanbacteria bacterium RBG_16_38_10]|uniref:Phosphoribosylformylglycinamidine synthase subunit PurL n=1 Tax=Candidatus Schekmanbacteria bacterium RBG_16_38_10 TaxID=1817879 RepID=A0A1F7RRQ7_9BACT|nr:MAG: phosphoribosylformylglycinamidine synthase II [Candidatus Schekmanbacteria bacterium RBG_16_38_10]